MGEKKAYVVACIPAYNEESSIGAVATLASKSVQAVIVCDDGSSDLTGEIASKMGLTVVRHERNMGYGAALRSLFSKALDVGADVVVTLDADGQHNPREIPAVVRPVLDGAADVAIGSRFLGSTDSPAYRNAGVKAATGLVRGVTGLELSDAQSGFRAYSREALKQITITEDGMGASTEILQKAATAKLKVVEVPIRIEYNVKNPSTYGPFYHFADVVASTIKHYSIRHPLLVYGIPGLAFILAGLAYGFDAIDIYSITHKVAVGSAIIAVGAITIGVLLTLVGVLLFTLINVLRESHGPDSLR
jgi:glycosyltransferase involved in cell wall biosynthesis